MARINIDDEWFITDPRRQRLITHLGCPFKADGMALAAWRLGQRYWRQDKQPIPADKWSLHDLDPILEVGLARKIEGGIYVCGTKEFAEWLNHFAALGSIGGKASVEARKKLFGSAQPPLVPKPLRTASNDASDRFGQNLEASNPHTHTHTHEEHRDVISAEPSPLSLVQLWNSKKANDQPAVREATFTTKTPRWRIAKARLSGHPDLGYWEGVVSRIAASAFCNAKNDRGWYANFDFLIRPDTHTRVMEGQYGCGTAAGHRTPIATSMEDL